jgi:hypothetical protein
MSSAKNAAKLLPWQIFAEIFAAFLVCSFA